MARRGGGGSEWKPFAFVLIVGLVLVYLQSGRGKANSRLIPDRLEDQIDHLVAALNRTFGHNWVTHGLDALQDHIERTMPGLAALVSAVHWAEQVYSGTPNAGGAKKQDAMRRAPRLWA